jgi:cob(I)alamin adenosyltransferase
MYGQTHTLDFVMRIYTKKGDRGTTSLLRGGRVQKDNSRVAAYGDVDELNAAIGVAAAVDPLDFEQKLLETIQRDLFTIGSILASADYEENEQVDDKMVFGETRIAALETAIDSATEAMPPLEKFVLPGGSEKSAMLHMARTVCRRAERSLVTLSRNEVVPQLVVPYMNRLSDLLFTLARLANARAGTPDREW